MTELIMSVVKFKVKEGCEDDFVAAWAEAPSTDCKFQRLLALDNNEYVSIAETDISGVLKREDDGIPWLDTVEHMLELFGDSRTDPYSGIVVAGFQNGTPI